jgi:hypothetical protein
VGRGGEKRKRSRMSCTFKSSVEDELCILQVLPVAHTHTSYTLDIHT